MNKYNLWAIIFCCWGATTYGFDSGLTTSIIGYPEFIEYFKFDSVTLGALGSTYYAGNFFGSLCNIWLPDKFGRLRTIQFACILSFLGAGLQTGAPNLGVLLAGRAIGGIACGIIVAVCPLFASELSPPHVRGRVGGLYNVNINVSYMVTEWMGLGFSYVNGDLKWRLFIGLQIFCAAIMLLGSFWMPFSPRWLVSKGRYDEALRVLERLHRDGGYDRGDGGADEIPFYQREFNQIKAQIAYEQENPQLGLIGIIKRPSYRRRLFIILFFFVFQQLTAIIPLQNYQVLLYQSLGLDGKLPLVLVGVWGTVGVIFSAVGASYFDRIGRRKSFFISMTLVTIGSILLTAFWATYEKTGNTVKTFGSLALWAMFVYLTGYALCLNAFGYAYTPEILPLPIRATGVATGFATMNGIIIMLVQVTPLALESITWKYFLIFVFMDVIFILGVFFHFPETANKPLEEIAALFGDEVVVTLEEATGKEA
ncbi:general substrate transporter [Eremomyces bilateralis CBS 781.70]|uniref:General substrate transporter n=1 Tax=Eremomyces bilateralis CBS 781.70 TaxID=1392243 RepID=A0A6G1GAT0_9PEZI|nr:general substrate transporter [Eremomyces bilateralis CBS 781.70]KAF1815175.1 general substrate transporter [Eremomyces bilateralis CBS 781.70]